MTFATRHSIILALLFAAPVSASGETVGLPNFHSVAPGVYRGGAPTAAGLRRLKAMRIHTIIDLRIAPKTVKQSREEAERLGFRWINLPMSSEPPTPAQVETLLTTLKSAPQEPVFVHCQHGADRTGCMMGIYRVTQQGWSFDQAFAEMRRYGFKPYLGKLKDAVRSRVVTPTPR